MRRLLSMVKKIVPLSDNQQRELSGRLRTLVLQPGEAIPLEVPAKSWIFVEEGFLMLMQCNDRVWRCTNFYYEGVGTVFYNVGAAELAEDSMQVQAVERSVVYYLTPAEEGALSTAVPAFSAARTTINFWSYADSQARSALHRVAEGERVRLLEAEFAFLLRAPADRLSEWLWISDKRLQMQVVAAKRQYEAKRRRPAG
jgi:hypothetical protein